MRRLIQPFQFIIFFLSLSIHCQPNPKEKITRTRTSIQKNKTPAASVKHEIAEKAVRETPPRVWNDAHLHLSPYTIDIFGKVMNENGIFRVANMSGGRSPEHQRKSLEATQKFADRIAHFANVDWSDIDERDFGKRAAKRLRQAINMGFAGLKISKALGLGVRLENGELLKVDDPRLDPLWEEAGKLGVVIAIHTGDPKAFFEPISKQNERYEELSIAPSWSFFGEKFPSRKELLDARNRVVKKHRNTTFMLVHFANNPEDLDYVEKTLRENPNVIVDVAARLAEIGRHDPKRVQSMFERYQDRIVFATDIQVGVQRYGKDTYLRVTLGSVSKTPPTLEDVKRFYDQHALFFETWKRKIAHPVPIQGRWKIRSIGLKKAVKDKVYFGNSEREIFAPWLGRKAAKRVLSRVLVTQK